MDPEIKPAAVDVLTLPKRPQVDGTSPPPPPPTAATVPATPFELQQRLREAGRVLFHIKQLTDERRETNEAHNKWVDNLNELERTVSGALRVDVSNVAQSLTQVLNRCFRQGTLGDSPQGRESAKAIIESFVAQGLLRKHSGGEIDFAPERIDDIRRFIARHYGASALLTAENREALVLRAILSSRQNVEDEKHTMQKIASDYAITNTLKANKELALLVNPDQHNEDERLRAAFQGLYKRGLITAKSFIAYDSSYNFSVSGYDLWGSEDVALRFIEQNLPRLEG